MTESAALEIESFSHVCVGVSDIERSLDFYRRIFGAEIVFDVELEGESLESVTSTEGAKGRMIGLLIGGAVVELLGLGAASSTAPRERIRVGYTNISFSVQDLDDAVRRVRALGYEPAGEPVAIGGVRMFFVADPDGTRVEIVEFPAGARTPVELWRGRADA
jgi:glyoxylase I family protein